MSTTDALAEQGTGLWGDFALPWHASDQVSVFHCIPVPSFRAAHRSSGHEGTRQVLYTVVCYFPGCIHISCQPDCQWQTYHIRQACHHCTGTVVYHCSSVQKTRCGYCHTGKAGLPGLCIHRQVHYFQFTLHNCYRQIRIFGHTYSPIIDETINSCHRSGHGNRFPHICAQSHADGAQNHCL